MDTLEQFRQSDIGIERPAYRPAGVLGGVVDARLLGVHVGAVDDCNACHADGSPRRMLCAGEGSIENALMSFGSTDRESASPGSAYAC
jgi:hypothetical protein